MHLLRISSCLKKSLGPHPVCMGSLWEDFNTCYRLYTEAQNAETKIYVTEIAVIGACLDGHVDYALMTSSIDRIIDSCESIW